MTEHSPAWENVRKTILWFYDDVRRHYPDAEWREITFRYNHMLYRLLRESNERWLEEAQKLSLQIAENDFFICDEPFRPMGWLCLERRDQKLHGFLFRVGEDGAIVNLMDGARESRLLAVAQDRFVRSENTEQ